MNINNFVTLVYCAKLNSYGESIKTLEEEVSNVNLPSRFIQRGERRDKVKSWNCWFHYAARQLSSTHQFLFSHSSISILDRLNVIILLLNCKPLTSWLLIQVLSSSVLCSRVIKHKQCSTTWVLAAFFTLWCWS